MNEYFLLELFLSFVVGGLVVTCCTLAAERFGTVVGGTIGGFPSTIAVALLFIGLAISPQAAAEATTVIPLIAGCNGMFLVAFAILDRRGLTTGLGGALGVWLALSVGAIMLEVHNVMVSLASFVALFSFSYYVLHHHLNLAPAAGRGSRTGPASLAARALLSGSVIALAVWLSQVSGPLLGGVLAVFPAVFLSTLFIAHRAQGAAFARSLTRPLMVSGLVNVVVYALCVRYSYPALGVLRGTSLALVVSLVSAYGTYAVSRRNADSTCRNRTATNGGDGESVCH